MQYWLNDWRFYNFNSYRYFQILQSSWIDSTIRFGYVLVQSYLRLSIEFQNNHNSSIEIIERKEQSIHDRITYFLHSIDIFTFRVINIIIMIKLLLWLAIFKSNDWIIYRFHGISIPFHPSCFHKPYLVSSNPNIPLILGTLDKPTSLND